MNVTKIASNCRRVTNKLESFKNRLKFKLYGVQYGRNLCVHGSIGLSINEGGSVVIGDNFYSSNGNHMNPLARNIQGGIKVGPCGKIIIGNNVGLSSVVLRCHKSISIGDNVIIGANTIIMDGDGHSTDYINRRSLSEDNKAKVSAPIIVEDDVLIGMNCMILKGVTIGARSIIGAGSVVTKSIPADCIAAGNPARVIKTDINSPKITPPTDLNSKYVNLFITKEGGFHYAA